MLRRAALGFRAHSGWAALVAVAGPERVPDVVLRGRVELCEHRTRSEAQPYHAAAEMKLAEAEAFLARCAATSSGMARQSIAATVAALAEKGCSVVSACVLLGSGRAATGLAATLASHPMIHTAEGVFFRHVLRQGCESCGLAVSGVKERELLDQAEETVGFSREEIRRWAGEWGKRLGPPWRQDEKLAAIAAWRALGAQG